MTPASVVSPVPATPKVTAVDAAPVIVPLTVKRPDALLVQVWLAERMVGRVLIQVVVLAPTVLLIVTPPVPMVKLGVPPVAVMFNNSSTVMLFATTAPLRVMLVEVASEPAEKTTSAV